MIPHALKDFDVTQDVSLSRLTTLGLGGRARYLVRAHSDDELAQLLRTLKKEGISYYLFGEGSNIVSPDKGFAGAIVQIATKNIVIKKQIVAVEAGTNLLVLIQALNRAGLSGMERMAGIPGTVGGAIYGNAGAYGQEIKDRLVSVRIFDGKRIRILSNKQAGLVYRTSIFKKHSDWVILAATFKFGSSGPKLLQKTSKEIMELRAQKYKPGLKCPGSFFKNIKLDTLPKKEREAFVKKIPTDKVMYGKVPAGFLLEEVGAKGMRKGGISIASHHANLFYNTGTGTMRDIKSLDALLKKRVHKKFGITLEEEVQYLPQ